jgi:hypothetical protein
MLLRFLEGVGERPPFLAETKIKLCSYCWNGFSALKIEATSSSETSLLTRPKRRHIPEGGILETY